MEKREGRGKRKIRRNEGKAAREKKELERKGKSKVREKGKRKNGKKEKERNGEGSWEYIKNESTEGEKEAKRN